jgi:hypothetical protein
MAKVLLYVISPAEYRNQKSQNKKASKDLRNLPISFQIHNDRAKFSTLNQ